jgi:hypothetical protein
MGEGDVMELIDLDLTIAGPGKPESWPKLITSQSLSIETKPRSDTLEST